MEEYSKDIQTLFLHFLITDSDLWTRSSAIIEPEYFHASLRSTVKFLKDYAADFNGTPKTEQVKAATGVELQKIPDLTDSDRDWFLHNIEQFCRHRALEQWLVKGVDYVQDGDYGKLESGLKDALLISLHKNLGTEYWENPKERLIRMRDNNGQVKTGWTELDKKLYGGFNRGELNIFAAGSGGGKSLFLQNIALNKAFDGLNVVYISLELSEELISMRLDAMVSGIATREIFKRLDTVHDTVTVTGKGAGFLKIKYMPAGTNTNKIKSYLKEVEIHEGKRPDVLIVDYLDLIHPNDKRINPSDHFIKDKFVSEELRGLANEMYGEDHKLLLITASQLNRSAVEEVDYTHANIAGGISKINTADNLFAIYTSNILRQRGRFQLQLMKTRSSAGVGEKIDLSVDWNTMRITDLDEDDIEESRDIFQELKQKSVSIRKNTEEKEEKEMPKKQSSSGSKRDLQDILKDLKNKK